MEIEQKLDILYGVKLQIKKREDAKRAALDAILTPEIRKKMAEIDDEFQVPAELTEKHKAMEEEIRNEVLVEGKTVTGNYLQAVWSKGRTSWNMDALEGYASAHPEIAQFKTIGSPSISIRTVATKGLK